MTRAIFRCLLVHKLWEKYVLQNNIKGQYFDNIQQRMAQFLKINPMYDIYDSDRNILKSVTFLEAYHIFGPI